MNDLRSGEITLIRRALRYLISSEQKAIQNSLALSDTKGKSAEKKARHAKELKEHAEQTIAAATALLDRMRSPHFDGKNPEPTYLRSDKVKHLLPYISPEDGDLTKETFLRLVADRIYEDNNWK